MLNLLLCFPGIGGDSAMLRYLSLDAEAGRERNDDMRKV